MKIKEIKIRGLFGLYNYYFHFDEESHYIILTSPNGYGKTTILKIIDAFAKSDLLYFYWLTYKSIVISFDKGSELSVYSVENDPKVKEGDSRPDIPSETSREVTFNWVDSTGGQSKFVINERYILKAIRAIGYYEGRKLKDVYPYSVDFRNVVGKNPRILQLIAREQGNNAFFLQINNLNTVFIEAQRIYTPSLSGERRVVSHAEDDYTYTIDDVAQRIKSIISTARIKYLEYSQNKSNRFIYRLLENQNKELSRSDYQQLRLGLLSKMQELKQFGLLDETDIPEFNVEHAKELSSYIAETQEKLSQLDGIYAKVRLFLDLINRKHFTAKKVFINRDRGLRVVADDQKWLELSELSSGEQNVIVMLYFLVFEYNNNKVLLIDEPEISLHVAWQYQYLEELEEILTLNDGQAIIATHSPQIIGERWDRCFDLTEQESHE